MTVSYPSGSDSTNESQLASLAASLTSSSVASLLPMRMLSFTEVLNRVTSWKTME